MDLIGASRLLRGFLNYKPSKAIIPQSQICNNINSATKLLAINNLIQF